MIKTILLLYLLLLIFAVIVGAVSTYALKHGGRDCGFKNALTAIGIVLYFAGICTFFKYGEFFAFLLVLVAGLLAGLGTRSFLLGLRVRTGNH